jgi:putative PIN family toxin of toxin-antitoxin system
MGNFLIRHKTSRMIPKARQTTLQRIVIDTNVCLDLFLFRDPRWQALMDGLKRGDIEAVTSASCRMEFTLVLAYEKMQLSTESQAAILQEFDQLIRLVDLPSSTLENSVIKLPLCKDRDDQKFLELAYASQADTLITKDKALLKLARKTIRSQLFRIFSPESWLASYVPKLDLRK